MQNLANIDVIWMLFCSALLLFMQAGFACLESGLVRSKNSVNVVMKNLIDLTIAFLLFGVIGFSIMFYQPSVWFSNSHLMMGLSNSQTTVFFIFQALFCATSITIVSGAVAERMSFVAYLIIAVFISAIIYPTVGSWIWGGSANFGHANFGQAFTLAENKGWLAGLGFYDYAGATVVHSVGGWIALATVMTIGPRIGRFGENSKSIDSSSITLTALGTLLIWIGWVGFNGGSLLRFTDQVPQIILNTILGGTSGMLGAMLLSYTIYKKGLVIPMLNGGLIGLVTVTGSANYLLPYHAIILGLLAGLLVTPVNAILNKFKIDDAIGVIPVHLVGGVFGTIVVAFVIPLEGNQTRLSVLGVQTMGVLAVGAFTFIISIVGLKIINKFVRLRVSTKDEIIGLNITEHNEHTTNADIVEQLSQNIKTGEVLNKISIDKESDGYEVARHYNEVVDMLEQLNAQKQSALEQAVYHANHDSLTNLLNRFALNKALEYEFSVVQRDHSICCVAILDIDKFKTINDTYGHEVGDSAIIHIASMIRKHAENGFTVSRAGGEEFVILMPKLNLENGLDVLENIRRSIEITPLVSDEFHIQMTISAGLTVMHDGVSANEAMKQADNALYAAKHNGRNKVMKYTVDLART